MLPKIFGNTTGTSEGAQPQAVSGDSTVDSMPEGSAGELAGVVADQHDSSSSGPTKMSQATDVYRRMTRKKGTTRKEIVAAFIEEVGLTKAGAATYYQMIKKGRR